MILKNNEYTVLVFVLNLKEKRGRRRRGEEEDPQMHNFLSFISILDLFCDTSRMRCSSCNGSFRLVNHLDILFLAHLLRRTWGMERRDAIIRHTVRDSKPIQQYSNCFLLVCNINDYG